MTTELRKLSREDLIRLRQSHETRRAILERRETYWRALIRACAALSREFAVEDPELAKYMVDLNVRGVARTRGDVGQLDVIYRELNEMNELLRAGDNSMAISELHAEHLRLNGVDDEN